MPASGPALSLLLDAAPDAPARARAAVAARIDDPEARADLELAASELVTAAVEDGPDDADAAMVMLGLSVEPDRFVLTVSGVAGPERPRRPGADLGPSILRALGCELEVRREQDRVVATCVLARDVDRGAAVDVPA